MLTEITKLISVILAISIASDRLVTFIKTLIPPLTEDKTSLPGANTGNDKWRKLAVMFIAFVASWFTAGFLTTSNFMLGLVVIEPNVLSLPCFLVGLLASGGSAFWSNLLNYFKGIKDINTQKAVQEQVKSELALAAYVDTKKANRINLALGRISNLTAPKFNTKHNLNFIKI